MSQQMILPSLPSAIFSRESGHGHTPCAAQGGRMTAPSGQAPVPASLSARQANEKELRTSGTCGPHSSASSASSALTQFLASRLQALTALHGSTLYRLTWKVRTTPAGRSIPALRAAVGRLREREEWFITHILEKELFLCPMPEGHKCEQRDGLLCCFDSSEMEIRRRCWRYAADMATRENPGESG